MPSPAPSAPPPTRQALLLAARDLFARHGYDGASVRAITTAAKANLGAITYHFGSKREMYAAVLTEELEPIRAAVLDIAHGPGSELDRIGRVVDAYFRVLADHPALPRLLLQEIAAGRKPPEPVLVMIRDIAAAVGGLQREGTRSGTVRDAHPVFTALSVVSQPLYMNLVAPLLPEVMGLSLRDPATREAAVDHAVEFVRRGLEPRELHP